MAKFLFHKKKIIDNGRSRIEREPGVFNFDRKDDIEMLRAAKDVEEIVEEENSKKKSRKASKGK